MYYIIKSHTYHLFCRQIASIFYFLCPRLFFPFFNHLIFSNIVTLLALNLKSVQLQISISYIHGELCSPPLLKRWVSTCLVKHHQSLMSSQTEEFFVSSWWPKIYVTDLRNIRTIKSLWNHHQGFFFQKNGVTCACVCQKKKKRK